LFRNANLWLGKNMFLVTSSGLLLGYFIPVQNSSLLRHAVIALFAYMTFVTALGTSFKDFLQVVRRPCLPLLILVLVHFVAPLCVWGVGLLFYPDDAYMRLGYLIGASIPIGVTSIIWTALAEGDTAASLVAVTLDTFLVPVILPMFFHVVIGQSLQIDYLQMMSDLLIMVTIPSIVGMLLHDWTQGKATAFSKDFGGATSKIALGAGIFLNSAVVMPLINWNLSMLKMLLVALLVVVLNFFLGYAGSFVLSKKSWKATVTMMYNVGIRNNSCGLVIALSYFPLAVAVPLTLSILYQQPVATLVTKVYKRFEQ